MFARSSWLMGVILVTASAAPAADNPGEWITLFNGTDLSGWKVRNDKYTVTKFQDAEGKEIKGARKGKVEQKESVVDAKNKPIEGAKVGKVSGKETPVDAEGKPIKGAKIVRSGGRDAILGADGKEIPGAKAIAEVAPNPTGGWKVESGILICGTGPRGSDLYTEKKFTDYELHVEFQATANSGVYPHGLYEIQIDNSKNVKPTIVEKDGKKIETLPKGMCGALYGRVAPSKNMAKDPKEWQTFDITFRAASGEGKTIKQKARITLVWNGEKVLDNVEIDGPTGGNLGGSQTEPGPVMLQGDHGRVSFRNIKLRPLSAK
jgi:Domain of Unknown Function (DUF1080)